MLNTMHWLPQVAPEDWQFTAMVGATCDIELQGFDVRRSRIDTRSPLRRIIWEQAAQPWQLREFDLYHAQAFVAPVASAVPSVVTVYDLSFVHFPQGLSAARRLYLRLLTPISCRRARRVIAISASTAKDLSNSFGIASEKIDIAPGGYDTERFIPLPADLVQNFRQKHGLPERFWLFVGTLEPRKNLLNLVEAYAGLPAHERLPLVIGGGKGWLYEDIFAAVERHGLKNLIRFEGFLPAENLPLWYNSAETFLFPSIYEGFGLPVVEAMACGTPVITSNVSSLPEAAGNSGILVDPKNVDALTAGLRKAFYDAEWRAQARLAGPGQAAQFSWRNTAERTIDSYRKGLK
ncbi:MAG: glycosyltransferase family 4 protein [Chloroflexi bacterium]|nr:glycosyltransferase family 4 protein [Chloroflexota bacterium]